VRGEFKKVLIFISLWCTILTPAMLSVALCYSERTERLNMAKLKKEKDIFGKISLLIENAKNKIATTIPPFE
jgi:hypothetical protein